MINTTTAKFLFDKTPKIACPAYKNIHDQWINGFSCAIENSIQYFCCITNTSRYCCSSDRYLSENSFSFDDKDNRIFLDDLSTSVIENYKIINKQFEQFQRYFLPMFLLTTTILLLVGIALWFWLYKHKTFYSLGDDDDNFHRRKTRPKDRHTRFSTTEV